MPDPNDPARPTARQQAGNRRIALAAGATVLGMVGLGWREAGELVRSTPALALRTPEDRS